MTWKPRKKCAEFLLACGSLIALPIGGWWVYRNFSAEDTHEANPNITVAAETMPYDDDRRLLLVHVRPIKFRQWQEATIDYGRF